MEINERTAIVIEWDHVDKTTKSFTISYEMGRKNDQEIIDEIAKCDAVCANCHRYRTHDRQDWKHDFNTPTENTDCPLFD
jgi:5-methylcytosine-specific restriction endonuclease McrA